jgi:6-phosphogluconolactonase
MGLFAIVGRAAFVWLSLLTVPAFAGTFVYVSNAEDGDVGVYAMGPDGELQPAAHAPAAMLVMPMAVSPNRRFLYAAVRSKPYSVIQYAIDARSGALQQVSTSPLAESFPYISVDKTGRYLFGASYSGHVISLNAIGDDGRVAAEPSQVIPVGRHAHSIHTDGSNRFVYVPTLGTDQIFQFNFDAKAGRLSSATPPIFQMKPSVGPRHFVLSKDNKFLYVLSELQATVTTLALDANTGQLSEVSSVSGLPADSKLLSGMPRGAVGTPTANQAPRNTDNDIWAADIHMTPDELFLYISERTTSSLTTLSVDGTTGKLAYLTSTPTEKQPRGFAIDPTGRFLVACGEKSETISVYSIDQATGALRPLRQYPGGKGANWIEIVSTD